MRCCVGISGDSLRISPELRGEVWGTDAIPFAWRSLGMKSLLKRFVREEEGQDLIEYALLAGFISLVAVTAITNVGAGVNGVYNNINAQVAKIPGGGS